MDENGIVIKCANCGRHLRNDEQPCPYCGYTGRNISVCLSDSIGMNESARGKMTNPAANVKKHAVQEFHKGDSYWRDGKKTVDRMWMVDRRNNFYKEDIRDKETGQVIYAVEEPLVKHVGHGSANKKKK